MPKMEKDKWVDGIMDSFDGLERAAPPGTLLHKIEQKLGEKVSYARTIPLRTVSLAAASILLLLAVNVYLLREQPSADKGNENEVESVIEYYGLDNNQPGF